MAINDDRPLLANPDIVFREEDEGSFLFDPDSGELKCLNLMGAVIWKLLDGSHSPGAIISMISDRYPDIPSSNIQQQVQSFLQELINMGYAGSRADESSQ
ncbi:MAG: PqqD family peptide modification chaperone [Thermodesulfobacteriota bacterium]